MNQDQSTAARGAVVGIATIVATIYPELAVPAMKLAGAAYAVLAFLKPYLPERVRRAF